MTVMGAPPFPAVVVVAAGPVIRQSLVPMLAGYLLLMGALGAGLIQLRRHWGQPGWPGWQPARPEPAQPTPADPAPPGQPVPAQPPSGQPAPATRQPAPVSPAAAGRRGWPALLRHVAATVAGGYLLLLVVDFGYYFAIAKVGGDFLDSAITGPLLLVGLSMPLLLAASWLTQHPRRKPPA